jgi:phenylacetate-CoA ligase
MRAQMNETDCLFGLDDAALGRLREARLTATLDRVFAAHPYFRRVFAASGIRRGDIATLADISSLPVTTKADYMAEPR